ncbi:TonB-dependent receptor [Hymenobacter algoricola]|uniref:TonB-dependent receptor plug domain-containing protein n=1 Tax=Hymenobacter algoricola TaxID=486267 RepID=A0ABP7NJ60_9BACT
MQRFPLPLFTGALLLTAGFTAQAQRIPGITIQKVPTLQRQDSTALSPLPNIPGVTVRRAPVPQPRDSAKIIRLSCRLDCPLHGKHNQPLFIVDGSLLAPDDKLSGLNPNDIEKINVLKGAAATALYGSRGQYGAIQITTKRAAKLPKPYPQRPMEAVAAP